MVRIAAYSLAMAWFSSLLAQLFNNFGLLGVRLIAILRKSQMSAALAERLRAGAESSDSLISAGFAFCLHDVAKT
jgi:hypothetical protein